MNSNLYFQQRCKEINAIEHQQLWELYKEYDNLDEPNLSIFLAAMHKRFNDLFKFMFEKKRVNGHFNADESRELLKLIDVFDNVCGFAKRINFDFRFLNENYKILFSQCRTFLSGSGGSVIPNDLEIFPLVDYEPILVFSKNDVVRLTHDIVVQRKVIGEGSYAIVSIYEDPRYNKKFIVKKAKKGLNTKELQRFENEYKYLQQLKSPYFVEVYSYDSKNHEYVMEYGGDTLALYIDKNNSMLVLEKRKRIVWQIFNAFEYLHSKGLLHRDISLTNILVKQYDDCVVVKICDLGLVKEQNSDLTSVDSEIKGSLNDSNLVFVGFDKYNVRYETFALTRLIYFVMTGKRNMENIAENHREFIEQGIAQDVKERFGSINEMRRAFNIVEW